MFVCDVEKEGVCGGYGHGKVDMTRVCNAVNMMGSRKCN